MINTLKSVKSACGAALIERLRALRWHPYQRNCPIIQQALKNLPRDDLLYAVFISRRYRYVYMDNPKTGCTSLKSALVQLELEHRQAGMDQDDWRTYHDRSQCPLTCLNDFRHPTSLSALQRQGYRFITFVRNPYSRLLSCYRDKIVKGKPQKAKILRLLGHDTSDLSHPVDFEAFVTAVAGQSDHDMDPHWRVQSTQILHGLLPYTFVGRFEHYQSDFTKAFQAIGIDDTAIPALPHLCRTKSGTSEGCRNIYTPALQARVYERYRSDFEHFGYGHELPE